MDRRREPESSPKSSTRRSGIRFPHEGDTGLFLRRAVDLQVHADASLGHYREDTAEDDRVVAGLRRPDRLLNGLEAIGKLTSGRSFDQATLLRHSAESVGARQFAACCHVFS